MEPKQNQRRSTSKGKRGGRRPGAGAPKGNLNALKTGLYSKQFAVFGALVAEDPLLRRNLLALGDRLNLRRRKANRIAAFLLARFFQNERQKKAAAEDLAPARRSGEDAGGSGPSLVKPARGGSSDFSPAHTVLNPEPRVLSPIGEDTEGPVLSPVEGLTTYIPVVEWDSIKRIADEIVVPEPPGYERTRPKKGPRKIPQIQIMPDSIKELVQLREIIKTHHQNQIRNNPADQLIDPLGWPDEFE